MGKGGVPKRLTKMVDPYLVTDGSRFRLKDVDSGDTGGLDDADKPEAKELLSRATEWLAEQQDRLYAQDSRALLLVFQAMDAAGKDGTIKHVMSGVNPQGCHVTAFKQPSIEELDHDFLWRCIQRLPRRGEIGIFNRSYYEEVLIVRVHRELLLKQRLPAECIGKGLFRDRLKDIVAFEDYLVRQGTTVLKFYLHVSRKEQKRRFLERIERPEKNWKFSAVDIKERRWWDDYMEAYEDAIRATAAKHAPWVVVPADHKWFTRLVVAAAIVRTLERMDLSYPRHSDEQLAQLAVARRALIAEK